MSERLLWVLLAAGLALALLACGPAAVSPATRSPNPPVTEPSPERPKTPVQPEGPAPSEVAAELMAEAAEMKALGDVVRERHVLQRLVREAPRSEEAVEARLRLGEDAVARGDWARAKAWLVALDASEPVVKRRRARGLALAHEGSKSWKDAAEAWLEALDLMDEGAPKEEARAHAARSLFFAGRPDEAAAQVGGEARLAQLLDAAITDVESEDLGKIYENVPSRDAWSAWVGVHVAERRFAEGDPLGAMGVMQGLSKTSLPMPLQARLDLLRARVDAWQAVEPNRIGVLLPLSGKYQKIGQGALEAIRLALDGRPEVRLIVRDTKGDAQEAAKQVEALVFEDKVAAILGPVGRKESGAAAAMADRLKVPHVVLSSQASVAEARETVFRVRVSPEETAAAMARYVVTNLDLRRVAILFPESAAGAQYMGGFWDEIVRLGGEVRAVEAYAPKTSEFGPTLKALIGANKPGEGTKDFEALFIPDDALTVRRLVPFLKYWGIQVKTAPWLKGRTKDPMVQLVGAAGWNHSAVVDRGDNLTDNAVFATPYVHDPDRPASDDFARAFYMRHQKKPSAFHAESHDAATLVAEAVSAAAGALSSSAGLGAPASMLPTNPRAAVIEALRTTRALEGATGIMTMHASGVALRQPIIMTIDLDELRPRLSEEEEEALRRARAKGLTTGPQ